MALGPNPTRTVPAASVDDAVDTLLRFGFHEFERDGDRAVLKKPGSPFAFRAHQRPMEVALVPSGEGEVRLGLRYDQLVVFDTGDLDRHADRLAAAFR